MANAIALQQKVMHAQQERQDLLGQLAELKDKVRELERAKADLDSYELFNVWNERFVYRFKHIEDGVPMHYACPRCYSGEKIAVMQAVHIDGAPGLHCSVCSFSMSVGPAPEKKERRIHQGSPIRPLPRVFGG